MPSTNDDIELETTSRATPAAAAAGSARQSINVGSTAPSSSSMSYPPVPDTPGPSSGAPSVIRQAIANSPALPEQPAGVSGVQTPVDRDSDALAMLSDAINRASSALAENPPATPASAITPALQVRLGVYQRLRRGILQLRGRTKLSLLLGAVMALGQVAAFSAVLGITADQQCDRPLRTYLILHIVKTSLSYPLSFYNTLAPRRPGRGEENTPEERARREARRAIGNAALDARLRTLADLVALFSLIWFLVGQVWTYSSDSQCKATSPAVWWSALATLIIAYIRIAEVILIILAVTLFLPIVILGLSAFGGLEKKHEIGPLNKDEIARLPQVLYVPAPDASATDFKGEEAGSTQPARTASNPTAAPEEAHEANGNTEIGNAQPKHRQRRFVRLFFEKRRTRKSKTSPTSANTAGHDGNGVYVSGLPHPLHPLPDNLSSCPICLGDYEAPPLTSETKDLSKQELKKRIEELEVLNLLPCNHAIHKDCLAPWLQTSGRCPVCQQAIYPDKEAKQKKKAQRIRRLTGTSSPPPAAATADDPAQTATAVDGPASGRSHLNNDAAQPVDGRGSDNNV